MITLHLFLRIATNIVVVIAAPCDSQEFSNTPSKGTVIAEYRSPAGPGFQIFGLDLKSDAMFKVTRARGGAFEVSLRTESGETFSGTAGTSLLIPSDQSTLDRISLIYPFPFLLPYYLENLSPDTCHKEQLSDGSTLYKCSLISGSVATTIRGLPEGFTAATHQVDFTIDPSGMLSSITRHAAGTTETLEYVDDPKNPRLAIPKSFANGGWMLHNYEIYPEGRPDLFTPENVIVRARELLIAYNERKEALSQTPEAKRQVAKSLKQLGGDTAPYRTTRFALILTGLIVIAVGSLAWWKNRS